MMMKTNSIAAACVLFLTFSAPGSASNAAAVCGPAPDKNQDWNEKRAFYSDCLASLDTDDLKTRLSVLQEAAKAAQSRPSTALRALTFLKEAEVVSRMQHGPLSSAHADATLSLAKGWMLAGHCQGYDARIGPMLNIAKAGYVNNDDARGIMATAHAMADLLEYRRAIQMAEVALTINESAEDWFFLGTLYDFTKSTDSAVIAYKAAYELAEADSVLKSNTHAKLKKLYFIQGDFDAIDKLKNATD